MIAKKISHRDYIRSRFEMYKNCVASPDWGRLWKAEQREKLDRLMQLDQETCTIKEVADIIGENLTYSLCSCCGKRMTFFFTIDLGDNNGADICFDCINNMSHSISIDDLT